MRGRLAHLCRNQDQVRLLGYACFGQCEEGPNVAFYPDGVWHGGLSQSGDAERVFAHARGEEALTSAPLELPEEERSAHLQNIGELVALSKRSHPSGRVSSLVPRVLALARPLRWLWR